MRPMINVLSVFLFPLIALAQTGSRHSSGRPNPANYYNDSFALVIGIGDYQNFTQINHSVEDAKAIYDYLINQGGFQSKNVFLRTTENHQPVNREEIVTWLGTTLPKIAQGNNRVLVYFSGHGAMDETGDSEPLTYLVPSDGRKDNLFATCISKKIMEDAYSRIKAKQVLFILDACHSGYPGSQTPTVGSNIRPEQLASRPALQLLSACRMEEEAFPGDTRSVLTEVLLHGLGTQSADLNRDGLIPTFELYQYVQQNIAPQTSNPQTPQMLTLKGDGQFIFFNSPPAVAAAGATVGTPGLAIAEARVVKSERVDLMMQESGESESSLVPKLLRGSRFARPKKVPSSAGETSPANPPPIYSTRFKGQGDKTTVFIPGGKFRRPEKNDTVEISSFWMDIYEVTNRRYTECVLAGACPPARPYSGFTGGQQPVVGVRWKDADHYCRWANKRLPSEAEWELVTQYMFGQKFPWGNQAVPKKANFCAGHCSPKKAASTEVDGFVKTAPVGSFPQGASLFGVEDLAGNVSEWVDSGAKSKPDHQVYRGGSWNDDILKAGNDYRREAEATLKSKTIGFRCAQSPVAKAADQELK